MVVNKEVVGSSEQDVESTMQPAMLESVIQEYNLQIREQSHQSSAPSDSVLANRHYHFGKVMMQLQSFITDSESIGVIVHQ